MYEQIHIERMRRRVTENDNTRRVYTLVLSWAGWIVIIGLLSLLANLAAKCFD